MKEEERHALVEKNSEELMQRLLKAGLILSYSKTRTPFVEWNPNYIDGMSGLKVFLLMGTVLGDMDCFENPLNPLEQIILLELCKTTLSDIDNYAKGLGGSGFSE